MSVLTLSAAAAWLNITTGQHDVDLQATINAAEATITKRCGPLAATAATDRLAGGGPALSLRTPPAISLTSVTPVGGTALTISDLYLDTRAGVVTFNAGATFTDRFYDVAYSAGRTTCPDDLLLAVKELVRHLWQTQRGPTRRPGSEPSEGTSNTLPGAAYLLPFRVSELIADHMLTVG